MKKKSFLLSLFFLVAVAAVIADSSAFDRILFDFKADLKRLQRKYQGLYKKATIKTLKRLNLLLKNRMKAGDLDAAIKIKAMIVKLKTERPIIRMVAKKQPELITLQPKFKNATVAQLKNGKKAFRNFENTWQEVPKALAGYNITYVDAGQPRTIHFRILKTRTVFAAQTIKTVPRGWLPTKYQFYINDRRRTRFYIYRAKLVPGTYKLLQADKWVGTLLIWK